MNYLDTVNAQLRIDEGVRFKPYRDSVGKLTIGVGRNLDDVGLRPDEINYLLANDMRIAENTAVVLFPAFAGLSDNRKAVLINMAFNLGQDRLSKFKRFRDAIESENFALASSEMLDSAWSTQVGNRAERLAKLIREG